MSRPTLHTLVLAALAVPLSVAAEPPKPNLPGDNGSYVGDRVHLRATAREFKLQAPKNDEKQKTFCAGEGSTALVSSANDSTLFLRFTEVAAPTDADLQSRCPASERVRTGEQYHISREALLAIDHARTGLSFGGLVIPFKYRLGDDRELIASPAIAPFVGYRMSFTQRWGFTFTPVAAAGLSLVPVPNADGKQTDNKAAYTVAVGFRITSSKNEQFTAGLLYGRDFLSERDTVNNPNLKKPWLSIYLGASI